MYVISYLTLLLLSSFAYYSVKSNIITFSTNYNLCSPVFQFHGRFIKDLIYPEILISGLNIK